MTSDEQAKRLANIRDEMRSRAQSSFEEGYAAGRESLRAEITGLSENLWISNKAAVDERARSRKLLDAAIKSVEIQHELYFDIGLVEAIAQYEASHDE